MKERKPISTWWHKKYKTGTKRTSGRPWLRLRHVVLVEEPVCQICGCKPSVEVDHIVPLCKGGTDERSNLQGVCLACHEEKTRIDLGIKEKIQIGLDGYPIEKNKI